MMANKYYSLDRHDWNQSTDNINEIITLAEENNDQFVFCAERIDAKFEEFFDVDTIIEDMQEAAHGEYGECTEGYLRYVTKEQLAELKTAIVGWAEKHNIQPHFFRVENIVVKSVDSLKNQVKRRGKK